MSIEKYKNNKLLQGFVGNMLLGYTYNKVVLESFGHPVDFIVLDVNSKFEEIVGIGTYDIIGKKITEIKQIDISDVFQLIKKGGEIALTGGSTRFDQYIKSLNCWYSISMFSNEKGYFVIIFDDITSLKISETDLSEKNIELSKKHEKLKKSYNELLDNNKKLSFFNCDLSENENKYRQLFDNSSLSILVLDKVILDCNQNLCDAWKLKKEDIIGRTPADFSPEFQPDGTSSTDAAAYFIRKSLVVGPTSFYWQHKSSEGKLIDYEITLKRVEINNRKVLLAFMNDITELKYSREILTETEDRYKTLVEFSPDGIVVHVDGKFVYVNPSTLRIFGAKNKSELIGKRILDFIHPDYRNLVNKRVNKALTKQVAAKPVEEVFIRIDGSYVDVEVSAMAITYNHKSAVQVVIREITERKKSDKALLESEERYRNIVDLSPLAIILHVNEQIVYANKSAALLLGLEESNDLVGQELLTLIHESERDIVKSRDLQILQLNQPVYSISERFVKRDGSIINAEVSLMPLIYQGKLAIQKIIRDVTAEKIIQDERKLNLERLNTLIKISELQETSSYAVFDVALEEAIALTHSEIGYVALYDESTDKIVINTLSKKIKEKNLDLDDFIDNIFREAIVRRIPVLINEISKKVKTSGKQQKLIHRYMNVPVVKRGKIVALIGVANKLDAYDQSDSTQLQLLMDKVWDISQRKKAEEALQYEIFVNKTLANISKEVLSSDLSIEKISQIVHKASLDISGSQSGFLLYFDTVSCEFVVQCFTGEVNDVNYFSEPIKARDLPVELCIKLHAALSIKSGQSEKNHDCQELYNRDYIMVPAYADEKLMGLLAIYGKDGGYCDNDYNSIDNLCTIYSMAVLRKHNEDIIVEAKLHAEESDRLKSAFLANMSHEIRTPMNGIVGFAELLQMPDLSQDSQDKYVGIIQKCSNQLMSIINDVIDISKIEAGEVVVKEKTLKINTVLDDLFVFFENDNLKVNDVELKVFKGLPDDVDEIIIDENKIKQILTNLISNALKFTSSGYVEFGYRVKIAKNREIEFFVKDTGIGIASENQNMIFDRFSQVDFSTARKYGGTGLGLAIVKALVEKIGGQICVESQVGIGSLFYFSIPLKVLNDDFMLKFSSYIVDENRPYNWSDKTILIAEDEEHNNLLLEEILRDTNAKVICVTNGFDAVTECKINPNIDVVLMDLKMPVMNGLEATAQIKEIFPHIKIIAQTAYAFSEDREKAFNAGCDDFIEKPIKAPLLLDKINYIFKEKE